MQVNDDTPFPYGKVLKGKPMKKVPAWFLISQYNQGKLSASFKLYVEQNMERLKIEAANSNSYLAR